MPGSPGGPCDDRARRAGSATAAVLVTAASATVAVVLLATASRYGFHRDELYFMANAEDPAWGYVDHPPLTPMVGWVSQRLFGDSVFGLRVIPALVGAGLVALTAAISREVDGDDGARVLAAWSTATTVAVLAVGRDGDPRRLLSGCARLGSITMPHDVDNEEQGTPVWRCAGPLRPRAELWPDVRNIS